MAGISGMRPTRFFFWDGLAACLSVPLMVAIGFYGATHVQRMRAGVATTEHYVAFAATLVAVVLLIWHHVRSLRLIPDRVAGEPAPAASR